MAKQKIVVKVSMTENKKRCKALKIAVSVCGVESAALQGADKDQIMVTGEGIDSVELTKLLRKNVGHTDLVSVGPAEEKKKEETVTTVVPLNMYSCNYPYGYGWAGWPY